MTDQPYTGTGTLVSLKVEGCKVNALAYSDSQVNTVMAHYVHQHEFPILPPGLPPKLNRVGRHKEKTPWLCDLASPGL